MILYAYLFESGTSSPAYVESLAGFSNLGIRCSLPGWLQKIELTYRAANARDSRRRYRDHPGLRLVILDQALRVVASGWVKEVRKRGTVITYVAAGAWAEHDADTDNTAYSSSATIDSVISTMIGAHVTRIANNTSNIDSNGTQLGSTFSIDSEEQSPQSLIPELLEFSNSTGQLYDYYLLEQGLSLASPQLALPYYRARDETSAITWELTEADLDGDGAELIRHIWDYLDEAEVFYGSGPTGTGGTSAASSPYGSRRKTYLKPKLNSTAAAQFESDQLNQYARAVQQQGLTIGGPTIRKADNSEHPLWEVIRLGPTYMRISIDPELSLYGDARDMQQTWFISAADYDHTSRTLRIVPELPDSRLDAVLARASGVEDAKGEYVMRNPTRTREDLHEAPNARRR